MKRYFHLQILVSMLCLSASALRHQRHFFSSDNPSSHHPESAQTPWTGGIAEAATEGAWGRGAELHQPTEPAVRYEESVLAEPSQIEQPNKGHLFTWNAEDPNFYDEKASNQKQKVQKKDFGLTPWRYFQRHRPAFHTSPLFHDNCPFC